MIYALLLLGILGLLDAIYLTYESFKKDPLVCPLDFDCDMVLKSKYATFYGIKNEYLGLLYYFGVITILAASLLLSEYSKELILAFKVYTGTGFLYSIYLTYLQAFKLKNYCLYCLVSAGISTLLFILSLFLR